MTIVEKHFGMTRVVCGNFSEIQQNDGKWQAFNENMEIVQKYMPISCYKRHLSFGLERIARIALGILCVIATLGFGLLTESVRRCFTGLKVLIVVAPGNEQFTVLNYDKLCDLPQSQSAHYERIKSEGGVVNLTLTLPDWNDDEQVNTWATNAIEEMKEHHPLPGDVIEGGSLAGESFIIDYEVAAYGYIRAQIDIALIDNERKSHLLCNIDQLMYETAVTRIANSQRNRGREEIPENRLHDLAQLFYDTCRAVGASDPGNRAQIRRELYAVHRILGLAN